MHFQFLIEDQSSAELIEILMPKIIAGLQDATFDCKSFHGLGGFTKKNTVKETRTGKLLNDLATYLRGFDKSLRGISAAIIIVLDNDTRDPEVFRSELENVAKRNSISVDHVFCIDVEEVEAWLLGDSNAIRMAYPNARLSVLQSYVQDSICGTWEVLADIVYSGGFSKFKKQNPTYAEIGRKKREWAGEIGKFMNIDENKSPSFRFFIGELRKRLVGVS